MNTKTFQIPVGYALVEKTEIENIDTAANILSSLKRGQYTRAKRNLSKGTAELVKHVLICPNCGEEVPAYAHSVNGSELYRYAGTAFDGEALTEWATTQPTLFEENEAVLEVNQICNQGRLNCPKCGCTTPSDERVRGVWFKFRRGIISVRCEILDFSEVIKLSWLPKTSITFPLFEEINFNLKKGHTYLCLYSGEEKIAVRDITSCPENMSHGAVYNVITANRAVMECIVEAYEDFSGEKIPFSFDELSPERYVALTRFVGFEREFYDAVPYEAENWKIESSFKGLVKKLHTSKNALALFEGSRLPKIKSVRRLFFCDEGLLFYLRECELFWDIIKDPNLFCKLLSSDSAYTILSFLHERGGIEIALRDLGRLTNAKTFVDVMLFEYGRFFDVAMRYAVMNEVRRKNERERWKSKKFCFSDEANGGVAFSRPLYTYEHEIKDCNINGYSFWRLRTYSDYVKVGKALSNCLAKYYRRFHNVFAVRRHSDGKYVAAIEIVDHKVVQAYAKSNFPMNSDEELNRAYNAWRFKYKLEECFELSPF